MQAESLGKGATFPGVPKWLRGDKCISRASSEAGVVTPVAPGERIHLFFSF
jgi:hypothetical protein